MAGRGAQSQHTLGVTAVGIAVTSWGLTSVLIKSLDMDSVAIGLWRFGLFAVLLAVVNQLRGERFGLHVMRRTALAGVFLAGDVMLFFTAVKLTTIVNATTIAALQPVMITAVAVTVFGERVQLRDVLAALIAIAGVVVIITQSAGTPEWNGWGDLAALAGTVSWSMYFVVAKRRGGDIPVFEFTIGTGLWVAVYTLPVGLIVGQHMGPPGASDWPALLALFLVGGVFGHLTMNWAIPRVPLWLSSTLTLLTPVVSSIAAWIWLDEPLTAVQVAAIAVVVGSLAAIVIAQVDRSPEVPEAALGAVVAGEPG